MKGYGVGILFLILSVFGFSAAQETPWEPMHPSVLLKDNGMTSCAQCHDTRYIVQNKTHGQATRVVGCIVCHLKGGNRASDGTEVRHLIQRPEIENCKGCHPISDGHFREPLRFPESYLEQRGITQNSGAVYSPQVRSRSDLNLQNKKDLTMAWDVHAQRHLACNDCHFTANDPRHCSAVRTDLDHLVRDPRRLKATSDYLRWPDHTLSTASCQCCHDPIKSHSSFPYLTRHLEALECLSCHVPTSNAPAFQTEDETVVSLEGRIRRELRGVDPDFDPQKEAINSTYIEAHKPILLSRPLAPELADRLPIKSAHRLAPFNLIARWFWQDGESGREIPLEKVAEVYRSKDLAGQYDPGVMAIFDHNGDRRLDGQELILDSADKVNLISRRLQALVGGRPVIRGSLTAYPVNHGTVEGEWAIRECTQCHSKEGRFAHTVTLSGNSPFGAELTWSDQSPVEGNVRIMRDDRGQWLLKREPLLPRHYVFGFSRHGWIDLVGLLLLFMTAVGIVVHAGLRLIHRRRHGGPEEISLREEYLYPLYERIWHWLMALGIIMLMITGGVIHAPGLLPFLGYSTAVFIHNVLAFIVVINGLLSLLYHLFSGEIRQFFTFNRSFIKEIRQQFFYYVRDIFLHRPHPIPKSRQRKLNPLQQLTYLALLNLLLPLQIVTGMLMWLKGMWPEFFRKMGILGVLAPVHYLGSWLLIIFLTVHLYLITTGHRPLSNLKAMITGYDELLKREEEAQGEKS